MAVEKKKTNNNEEVLSALGHAKEAIEYYERTLQATRLDTIDQLGSIVTEERKKQKITLDVLAKLSGLSVGTIIAIESGKTSVSLSNVQKVLNALGRRVWIR